MRGGADPGQQRQDPPAPLNRGGDRAANNALYTVVLTRLRLDGRTRRYVARRTTEGLSRIARELYQALVSLPPSSSSWPPQGLERAGQP